MIIILAELIDLVIMVAALAFIFKDIFRVPPSEEPLDQYRKPNFSNFKFAAMVTAPAIVLHEAAHKITALLFGIAAVFHAHYFGLGIGIALKLLHSPFVFFVPGFVSYSRLAATPLQSATIAIAGPLMNLILWIGAGILLKQAKNPRQQAALYLTKQINMFLFIFNMIPFAPFDGGHFFSSILAAFG